MIGPIVRWIIDRTERSLGASLDYMRYVYRVSPGSFHRFAKIQSPGNYRRVLSRDAYHVSRIVATRAEDCGSCVQIAINLAKRDGVDLQLIQCVSERNRVALNDTLRDVYDFAESVALNNGTDGEYRERLKAVMGEEAFVELCLAITMCRTYPTFKRALGYASSCSVTPLQI